MAEATLKFQLPEEREEFELAANAGRLHSAAWDFTQWLRAQEKYGEAPQWPTLDVVRRRWHDTLAEHGVEL